MSLRSTHDSSATFLVVGDVHRHWRRADAAFLERQQQDLALFVGDLGDEDVELVREVSAIRAPKAVMLGNHDAWQSFTRKRPTRKLLDSLSVLGEDHLAYGVREVPRGGVSLIGARPFSWGGKSLRSPELYRSLYGVENAASSAEKIVAAAGRAQHRDLVILAHNGPTGLSKQPEDIWGKDFGRSPGGDWGDRDLEIAIERIRGRGLRVRCVVAGHMHDRLVTPRGAQRERFVRRDGVLYVNAAVVPRIRSLGNGTEVAHYLRLCVAGGDVREVEEIWVDPDGEVRIREPRR